MDEITNTVRRQQLAPPRLTKLLAMPGVFPFLYGKAITKPFRKMGHITVMDADLETLRQKVADVQGAIRVISE